MSNILVTGATGGIGRAIASALADAGYGLVLHCNRSVDEAKRLLNRTGAPGAIVQADLSRPEGARILWQGALESVGEISGLVNNAGVRSTAEPEGPWQAWHEAWSHDLQVNLQAPVDLIRLCLPHFRSAGYGRIVNISSRAGQRGYADEYMPYGASKAALINVSKSVARNHGHEGVSCVAIAPGFVSTDMAEEFVELNGFEAAVGDIPVRQMVEPNEIAKLVVLCLDAEQISLNGATLDVNGGSYLR